MSLHTKLVVSILALSVLGVILLSSVLFDSHQQSNNRLHLRTLEQHVVGIAASLSRHAVEAGDSTQTLIEAVRSFNSNYASTFVIDPSGRFLSTKHAPIPDGETTPERLFESIRTQNASGMLSSNREKLLWSKAEIPGTAYQVVLLHREQDDSVAHFMSEFGAPMFVTVVVFLWISTWAALILGALFKKLDAQKRLLEEQTTDVAEARDKALKASMAKGEFLANMSHEIRTPLTAIIGFSESLLSSDQTVEERIKAINTINHSGKHLLHVIDEILDLSKIEANKLTVERIKVSPVQLLQEIDSVIRMQAAGKGLAFDIYYNFPIPDSITTDPTRLKQILLNLAGNAIKFTEKGSIQINVSFDPQPQQMVFEVVDTGIGMTTDQARNVFDAFTQADTSITRKYGGTGLGLTLSSQLSEMLGGSLSLDSEIGVGSRFTVTVDAGDLEGVTYLSQTDDAAACQSSVTEPIPANSLVGSVLIAEDNPANQALLKMYVTKAGATATVAEDGQRAVEHAFATGFDLIFMDMQMPKMSGIEATAELRERGYNGPIIALTANSTTEDRALCLQAGCDDFLPKPIDRDKFFKTLDRYLPKADTTENDSPVISKLIDEEPDLVCLLEGFIGHLPASMDALESAAAKNDWDTLKEQAHQLKGLGGGYGYPDLTTLAGKLEFQIINRNKSEVASLITAMTRYCERIYAGARETFGSQQACP
jgi:signal transduction histidine kinase/CheY-like chemotaxis protein/HPt (histidine-containing phosphotransfer) domain-containing protein